jgi:hypothetical protein
MILICEFYIEDGDCVYTSRSTVLPLPEHANWQAMAPEWADRHLPNWINIECFKIESTGVAFHRVEEDAE